LAVLLAIAGTVVASCADISHKIVDTIPEWAGGMPKKVPPRPGTPEYDAWMEQQQAEAARDAEAIRMAQDEDLRHHC
jgi:hypothetical protein